MKKCPWVKKTTFRIRSLSSIGAKLTKLQLFFDFALCCHVSAKWQILSRSKADFAQCYKPGTVHQYSIFSLVSLLYLCDSTCDFFFDNEMHFLYIWTIKNGVKNIVTSRNSLNVLSTCTVVFLSEKKMIFLQCYTYTYTALYKKLFSWVKKWLYTSIERLKYYD